MCEATEPSYRSLFSLHGGVDLFGKGSHVGAKAFVHRHLSLEVAFGIDGTLILIPIFGLIGEDATRYSVGLNWHKGDGSHFFSGLTYTYLDFRSSTNIAEKKVFSAMIGSCIIDDSGFAFYYRGGLALVIKDNNAGQLVWLLPNIDFGLNINLF